MHTSFKDSNVLGHFVGPTGMTPDFSREAIARLVGACESIIERGLLGDADEEFALRVFTNAVCNAFDMKPVQETEQAL